MITVSTAVLIKNNKNFGSYIRAIFDVNVVLMFVID